MSPPTTLPELEAYLGNQLHLAERLRQQLADCEVRIHKTAGAIEVLEAMAEKAKSDADSE